LARGSAPVGGGFIAVIDCCFGTGGSHGRVGPPRGGDGSKSLFESDYRRRIGKFRPYGRHVLLTKTSFKILVSAKTAIGQSIAVLEWNTRQSHVPKWATYSLILVALPGNKGVGAPLCHEPTEALRALTLGFRLQRLWKTRRITDMRVAAIIATGLLLSAPAFAQTTIIQGPNPGAAAQAGAAAGEAHHDARVEEHDAHRDQAIANHEAAEGNYGAAAHAEHAAQDARHDAHVDNHIANHDANVSRQDDSVRITTVP
jgi:hypothetical protein